MDLTSDRLYAKAAPKGAGSGDKVCPPDLGLPESLDEAALLMIALSFGPLTKRELVKALNQAGVAPPGGALITPDGIASCIRRLRQRDLIAGDPEPPTCNRQIRQACVDAARAKGYLVRLGQALQQAVPGQNDPASWEFRWNRQQFRSLGHACRDVLMALERNDQAEIRRLALTCSQDSRVGSIIHVLRAVCMEPFQPYYLDRIAPMIRDTLLVSTLQHETLALEIQHPVFDYVRSMVRDDRRSIEESRLNEVVVSLAERDILAGDFEAARALLEAFADLDTHAVRGMLELLSGRLEEARHAYDLALHNAGRTRKDQLAHLESLPGALHVLLLVQSERLEDHVQVRTWLDWLSKTRGYGPYEGMYQLMQILLAIQEGTGAHLPRRTWLFTRPQDLPLARAGTCVMQLLYCLHASDTRALRTCKDEIVEFVRWCQGQGARWPMMQISRLMDRLNAGAASYNAQAEAFFSQTPARDLAELWKVREVWEGRICALERLLHGVEQGKGRPVIASRRLAWKLSEYGEAGIRVTPVEQGRTRGGAWTRGREIALHRLVNRGGRGLDCLTEQDKAAVAASLSGQDEGYGSFYGPNPGITLEALIGHPNVFWEGRPQIPVEVVKGSPEVHIVPKGQKVCIRMDPYPNMDLEDPTQCRHVIKESTSRIRVLTFERIHVRMAEILGADGLTLPKDRAEEALARLQGLSRHVAIRSDVALAGTEAKTLEPDCRPRLRLQRMGQGLRAEMVVVPLGSQSSRSEVPGRGSLHLVEPIGGEILQTRRDLQQETALARQALDAVEALNTLPDSGHCYLWVIEEPDKALELLEQLQSVACEVLTVEWPKGDPIKVRSISSRQVQLSIRPSQNWFEVDGTVQVDQDLVIKMRTLLDKLDGADKRFIALGQDQYVVLTRQLRSQLQWLSAGGHASAKGDGLRMHPLAAIGLEPWKAELGGFQADPAFDAHVERFRRVESYHPAVPSTLQATLRPYQRDGFVWLARLAEWGVGACLADDMGLGKTVEALALILHRASQGPTLVAAPTSVCANWVAEAQRFAPTLRPIRFGIGDLGRRSEVLKALGPFDLVVCSYTLLQQEADSMQEVKFATIVLDEAQAIKNAATKRSAAAMTLNGGFRMISTGTPIENRLAELWNLFRFINPGLLGSEQWFRERFVRPIEADHDPQASHVLKSLVQPFILRRTKSQVLEDLPPRTEVIRRVELSSEERALHESLRRRAMERLERMHDRESGQARIQVLAELMRLRRCCCNPRLVVPDCGLKGSKLEAFADLVEELLSNQHKALVFSQFVDHLTLLREHLDQQQIRYQYLDGQTPPKARQKRIEAFQNGEGDLFLISLRAGGLGLNLTAADYVIHMDPWWNPAVEDQASDRAHRIGQTRPVTVYRLVAEDTIEEKIVELHHEKRDLADSLLEGADAAHTLTADELIGLLRNR
jgi:superfamily II DNA or RNA helicase/tetratricopeptide (TPR) repeat protein